MLCSRLPSLLGIACHPLSEDGSIALIETPLVFDDKDEINVYVEKRGSLLRFFDDGEVLLHFRGRGMRFDDGRKTRFIDAAGEPFGVALSEAGELQIWTPLDKAPAAFAAFLSALTAIVRWEHQQQGSHTEIVQMLDEVEMYLRAWRPGADIVRAPEYRGLSGQVYKLDFALDGQAVAAIGIHHSAVNSTIRKMLDIANRPDNERRPLVILDDRGDPEAAKKEALVIQTVSEVMHFSALERNATRGLRTQN